MYNNFFLNFIKINYNDEGKRIDNFLFKKIKCLPRSKIYSLLRKGNIRVNKKRISFKYRLKINDLVRIPLVKLNKNNFSIDKYTLNLYRNNIIYEDLYLLIINKPSGVSVHSGTNSYINIIDIYRFMNLNICFLELIHRLDKDTSGILLLSKNKKVLKCLHKDFKNCKIIKKYICLVYGYWPLNINKVENFIVRDKYNKYISNNSNNGKYSKTLFKVYYYLNNCTLISAKPLTGRTHQIRLQTSFLGYPIIFDRIYGNKKINSFFKKKFNFERLFLHCNYICFKHPIFDKKMYFNSKIDSKLLFILNSLKKKGNIYGCSKK